MLGHKVLTFVVAFAMIAVPALVARLPAITVHAQNNQTFYAWGRNDTGVYGSGSFTEASGTQPVTLSGFTDFKSISSGYLFGAAVKNDGSLWTWGDSTYTGWGGGTSSYTPIQVTGISDVKSISIGFYHTLVLKNDGTVWSFGPDWSGGLGRSGSGSTPAQVPGLSDIKQVKASNGHSMALTNSGDVYVWGYNDEGRLGTGDTTGRNAPTLVSGVSGVKYLSATNTSSLLIMNDGNVKIAGNLKPDDSNSPTRLTFQTISGVSDVVSAGGGWSHYIVLKSDGSVYSIGYNDYGQLGLGDRQNRYTSFTQISSLGTSVAALKISNLGNSNFVIKKDGTLWGWGSTWINLFLEGYNYEYDAPVQVANVPYPQNLSLGIYTAYSFSDPPATATCTSEPNGSSSSSNGNTASVYIGLHICAGNLTITAPATVSLSGINVSSSNETSSGTTSEVYIQDLRGSDVGWSATATITNFGGNGDNAGDVIPLFCQDVSYFTLTPGSLSVTPGDPGSLTGLTDYTNAQITTSVSDLTSSGVSNAFGIASFASGYGAGKYQKMYSLALEVVANGNYTDACPGLQNKILRSGTLNADLVSSVA